MKLPKPVTFFLTERAAFYKSPKSGLYSGMIFYPGGVCQEQCEKVFWRWIGAC